MPTLLSSYLTSPSSFFLVSLLSQDNVFSDDVSGIHCVLQCSYPEHGDELLQLQLDADVLQEIPQDYRSTVETSFTFTIKNGVVDSM
jgi:hypothetical protein